MKHLIIYTHPNPESLNGYFKNTLIAHLNHLGHEVVVRDLYDLNFYPVLSLEDLGGQLQGVVAADVQVEQEWIRWADRITFIYPIWWTGLPAMMKGYIDKVFSYGFAYSYTHGIQEGLLKGKEAVVINTHGKSNEEYQQNGLGNALSLTSDQGIFSYCGFEIIQHFFFGRADRPEAGSNEHWIEQIKSVYHAGI